MDLSQRLAIEALYRSMYKMLFLWARQVLGAADLAEDAVQETFRIACAKPDFLRTCPNPEGWLMTTLQNTVCNLRRMDQAYQRLQAKATSLYDTDHLEIEDLLSIETLRKDLAETAEFQFLKPFVFDGLDCSQVARRLGITVNACRVRKSRALKVLRERILEKNRKP